MSGWMATPFSPLSAARMGQISTRLSRLHKGKEPVHKASNDG